MHVAGWVETMTNWDNIRIFLAVATKETQKDAGKSLGLDQATVGRRIKDFEETLGCKLFDRTSGGYVLNSAGQQLLNQAKNIENIIMTMERCVSARDKKPQGIIRLALPGGMAHHWLIPQLKPFFEKYPDIKIHFLNGPETVNLWKREADIAIRLVKPTQKDLFYKKIGDMKLSVYGSQNFLREVQNSKMTKSSINEMPFIRLYDDAMSEPERLLLHQLGPIDQIICQAHAWTTVYHAVRHGIGIGILPSFYASQDKDLLRIPDLPETRSPVWVVMHPDVKISGRVRALTHFLGEIAELASCNRS